MDPRLLAVSVERLAGEHVVAAPTPEVAEALRAAGFTVHAGAPSDLNGPVDAVALLGEELTHAGEHAESLIARSADLLRPGGLLLTATRNPLLPADAGGGGGMGLAADEIQRALGHRGFAVELLCAPGAADRLAGIDPPTYRPELDRRPGLLDAGDLIVAVGRLAPDGPARSSEFFATLPRKVVAAAVICRDADDRLLVVHDSFKGHWTIPGGVVDPGEDPQAGAVREAWEEAGVKVEAGPLLGVFAADWPDRLVFVYGADPIGEPPADPAPVHAHEIDAVAWVPLDEALGRLAPHIRSQVTRCLQSPGQTWPAGGPA